MPSDTNTPFSGGVVYDEAVASSEILRHLGVPATAGTASPPTPTPTPQPRPTCRSCRHPIVEGTPVEVWTPERDDTRMMLHRYHQSCAPGIFRCLGCMRRSDSAYARSNGRGQYLCYECMGFVPRSNNSRVTSRYVECTSCGHWYRRGSSVIRLRPNRVNGTCNNCVNGSIEGYGADPDFAPRGRSAKNIYYGVELETEMDDSWIGSTLRTRIRKIKNALSRLGAILKSDGSLSNGFEIVTSPCSLDLHRKSWSKFLGTPLTTGLKSFQTGTCGLHVHASRAIVKSDGTREETLSELAVAKIVCFTNARHNRRFISVIAGRGSNSYSALQNKRLQDKHNWEDQSVPVSVNGRIEYKVQKKWKKSGNRYEAVNLENENTIEFRIFKGTLKKEAVFKAIEFCEALVRFCAPDSRSVRECMRRSAFIAYVMERQARYPHLAAFISARWQGIETTDSKAFGFRVTDNETNADQETEAASEE